jgi:hypothetical protein
MRRIQLFVAYMQNRCLRRPSRVNFGLFVAWAVVPPQSPYTVALRLFTFDGRQFHTLWAPPDILTVVLPLDNVVEITPTGFTVNRAIDSTGGAAHSPNVIIHEQYALSVNGPVKITETQEPNR